MCETWPTPEERQERREALHEQLDAFLDSFVDDGGDGGWAKATRDHIDELGELFGEVLDLKFQRDEDGDRTVRVHFENRRDGRLVSAYFPYDPSIRRCAEPPTELDMLRWQSETISSAGMLQSIAAREIEVLNFKIRENINAAEKEIKINDLVAAAREAYHANDRDTITGIIGQLLGDYVLHSPKQPRKTPLITMSSDVRRDEVLSLWAMMNTNDVEARRAKIIDLIETMKTAPVDDRKSENDAGFAVSEAVDLYGRSSFADAQSRFREISQARHVARKQANKIKGA